MKQFVRKIQRVSTHSYAIILPKELVEGFGWREGQKLTIENTGKKAELTVRDWRPGDKD